MIYSDFCGLMYVDFIGWSKYVFILIDDYIRYVKVYFIKSKFEVLLKFVEYVSMVENEIGLCVWVIRIDNGGEYTSQ